MIHREKLKVTEMNRLSTEAYKAAEKTPLTIVLDNVRSLHNVGSVFRTADAFLAEKIYLCGITSTPPNAELHKTALGAEFSVDWEYAEDTLKVVERLKSEGYIVLAIEQAKGSTLFCVEIPQYGTKHSLNVSVTAGIIIYKLATTLMRF